MTSHQDQIALRDRLQEVLGPEHTATLIAMFLERDDLATKSELFSVRDDLKDEISGLRMEMTEFKSEIRSEVPSFGRR